MEAKAHPPVATREEWLRLRKELLEQEKEQTRTYDQVNARRRRLPMVKVEENYLFQGPDGTKSLADLFEGRTQLIVYHFMFDPAWEKGCMGCTGYVQALGDLSLLAEKDTNLVLVSRAPLAKLEAYKKEMGWTLPWYSSSESRFNWDFGVTLDPGQSPLIYNFHPNPKLEAQLKEDGKPMETHGLSVFFKAGDEIFHTYSVFARGTESLTDSYRLLDVTPYGRQQDFEDSPEGWPQSPTYG